MVAVSTGKIDGEIITGLVPHESDGPMSDRAVITINALALAEKVGLKGNDSQLDIYLQVVEGHLSVVIDGQSNFLVAGEGIAIPIHAHNYIIPRGRFKMLVSILVEGC